MAVQIEKETFTPYRLCLDEIVAGNTPIHRPDFGEFESLVMQLQKQDAPNVRATMLQTMLETSPGLAALYSGTSSQDEDQDILDNFIDADNLDTLDKPEWLIYNIWPTRGVNFLYGKRGCGKTYVALSMACSVAMEASQNRAQVMLQADALNWCNHATKHGHVVYVAGEDIEEVAQRVQAWKKHHGISTLPRLHFYQCPLNLKTDTPRFIRAIKKKFSDTDIALIIVDTLAVCSMGIDENKKGEFDGVLQALEDLWREFGCCVIACHHAGKNGDMRGTSSMDGIAYSMIEVSEEDENIKLRSEKKRRGKRFEAFYLNRETVELPGLDEAGDPVTSCVVTPSDRKAERDPERLTDFQQRIIDVIQALGGRKVARSDVMNEMSIGKKTGQEKTFNRAVGALLKKELISSTTQGRNTLFTLQEVEGKSEENTSSNRGHRGQIEDLSSMSSKELIEDIEDNTL
jgi:hypothetical protein